MATSNLNDDKIDGEVRRGTENMNSNRYEYESMLNIFVYPDRERDENVKKCVGQLGGETIDGFESGGEKMLYFPSVLQILEYPSAPQLSKYLSKLNIPLVKPTHTKLFVLTSQITQSALQHHIPSTFISQSNAERLFRVYNNTNTRHNESHSSMNGEYSLLISMATELPEDDEEISESKQPTGLLYPQLYTNINAACIRCITVIKNQNLNHNCCQGELYSPEEFFTHTLHNNNEIENEEDKENVNKTNNNISNQNPSSQIVHWGLSSENWRFFIKLVPQNQNNICARRNDGFPHRNDDGDDDNYEGGQELYIKQKILEDVKMRFIEPSAMTRNISALQAYNSATNNWSNSCSSLNTTPSMPTPVSLSPSDSNSMWRSQSSTPNVLKSDGVSSEQTSLLIPALLRLSQDRLFAISLLQHEIFKHLLSAVLLSQQLGNGQNDKNDNQSDELSGVQEDKKKLDALMSDIRMKAREFKRRSHLFEQNRKRKLQNDQRIGVPDSTQESQNDLQTESTNTMIVDDRSDPYNDNMYKRHCGMDYSNN